MEPTETGKPHNPDTEWRDSVRAFGTPERERFVLAHAPMVRFIAQRILQRLPSSVELSDLVNDGVVGLIEAIERYDPARGVRFASFAESRVRGAILDSLRARDLASRSLRRRLRELDSAAQRAEQRLGRAAGEEEVAEELGVDPPYVSNLLRDRESTRTVATDPRLSETAASAGLYSQDPDPFETLSGDELKDRMTEEVERLPERDRMILSLYYEQELTMKEIGKVLGITESRICQIHTRTMRELERRLRHHLGAPPEAVAGIGPEAGAAPAGAGAGADAARRGGGR
jgi:RNA polymerase sigma factor for flagellar operon FliA